VNATETASVPASTGSSVVVVVVVVVTVLDGVTPDGADVVVSTTEVGADVCTDDSLTSAVPLSALPQAATPRATTTAGTDQRRRIEVRGAR
jgi:hypothetical protein